MGATQILALVGTLASRYTQLHQYCVSAPFTIARYCHKDIRDTQERLLLLPLRGPGITSLRDQPQQFDTTASRARCTADTSADSPHALMSQSLDITQFRDRAISPPRPASIAPFPRSYEEICPPRLAAARHPNHSRGRQSECPQHLRSNSPPGRADPGPHPPQPVET